MNDTDLKKEADPGDLAVVDGKTVSKTNKKWRFTPPKIALVVVLAFAVLGAGFNFAKGLTTTHSLWSTSVVPQTITSGQTVGTELGVRFSSKYAGKVTGVRFYKGAQNTGTHTGTLWTNDGQKLATVTFSNETASGWQTAYFPQPVAIAANVKYVISYFAPHGRYSFNTGYFNNRDAFSGPLSALRDSSSTGGDGNGLYVHSSTSAFPNQAYQSDNFWVDVIYTTELFDPSIKPAPPDGVTAAQSGSSIVLKWGTGQSQRPLGLYWLLKNGQFLKLVGADQHSYTDTQVIPGQTYAYTVRTVDTGWVASVDSNKATVTYNVVPPPSCPAGQTGTPPNCISSTSGGAKLLWSDEFNGAAGSGVDTTNWEQIVGAPTNSGRQEEYDTGGTSNVNMDGTGNLRIIPKREDFGGRQYTTGRIESKSPLTFYSGYLEFRAKLTTWSGTSPSLWTYGAAGYGRPTAYSEIDVVETRTRPDLDPTYGRQTVHGQVGDTDDVWQLGFDANKVNFAPQMPGDAWHTYGVYVNPSDHSVTFYVDHVQTAKYSSGQQPAGSIWPFVTYPQKVVIDVEMGLFSGNVFGTDRSTDTMYVDYVRNYDKVPF